MGHDALKEEIERLRRALDEKERELQRANALKSVFLANMSHELRTPLNSIIGFSELLLEAENLTERQQEHVRDVFDSGHQLLNLINDILDLSKIEAGHRVLDLEDVDPSLAVADACSLYRGTARRKRISISTAITSTRRVRADVRALRQILQNLLSNALKFSEEGGAVMISAEDGGPDQVRFRVRDLGKGVATDLVPHLFEPFFQGESPLIKRHAGTGLGLAITRNLVLAHGGAIALEAVEGAGASFAFTLPAASPVPAPAPALAPERTPAKVLVVDDHDVNRELARAILERRGYVVICASSGDEAIALARVERPALILMDLAMPGKDGYQVATELHADPELAAIPLVALTAMALRKDEQRALLAGFDGYVTKPIDRKVLEDTVLRFTARKV